MAWCSCKRMAGPVQKTFYAAAEALHNSRRIRALRIKRRTRRFLALVKTCLAWPGPIAFCSYLQADVASVSTWKRAAWKFWKPVRLTGRFWKCERDRGRSRWGYVAGLHSKWFLKHLWWFGGVVVWLVSSWTQETPIGAYCVLLFWRKPNCKNNATFCQPASKRSQI